LRALESGGLVRRTAPDQWALTDKGVDRARELQVAGEGEQS